MVENVDEQSLYVDMLHVESIGRALFKDNKKENTNSSEWYEDMLINRKFKTQVKLDSGAQCNVITVKELNKIKQKIPINKSMSRVEKQEDTEMSGPTTENLEQLNATVGRRQHKEEPLENVERWINFMEGAELAEALEQLELKTDSSMLQKKARLYQWLSGDFSANDFVESNCGGSERVEHHVSLRAAFINTTCWEKSGETIIDHNIDNDQPHPMIGLDTSEQVRRNLERSLGQDTMGANTIRQTSMPSRLGGNKKQPGMRITNSNARVNEPTQENIESSEDTSILSQVEELKKQMEEMRSQNSNGKVASSTRLDPRASSFKVGNNLPEITAILEQPTDQRRVNFQDTISYGPAAAGDWRKNLTEDINTRFNQNLEGSSNAYLPRTSTSRLTHEGSVRCNSDIGETVRKWRIQFEGFGQMSVESYIERIEECAFLAGLSDADLLPALSETLSGTAAQWFRSNRHKFQSWEEFCRMARKTFGMDQYTYQQLLEQIRRRTQGRNEKVAEYRIGLQSTLDKLRPQLAIQTQLDYLHGGMLPELQKMVRRKLLRSVDDLFDEAVEAENTIIRAEQYRAPTQDETVWPELRYQADKNEPSYKLAAMPDHKDEITALIKSQIEVTQLLANSIKESEKRQAEALQQISKSITQLQKERMSPAGKPDEQVNGAQKKEFQKNAQTTKNT
ncbi:unnamed protein product, partial [Trichogramma brassicae]